MLHGAFGLETQTLDGVHVQHDRMVGVFDAAQRLHQRMHVVALLHVTVVKAERLEDIGLRGAVRCAQTCEPAVHAAEILGDRHLVVVDDDDEVAALLRGVVQSFEGDRGA